MENPRKNYCLRVWGEFAAFNRPELKVERLSYDVITPSAARAIFSAIFWKPAVRWHVTKIEVLKPIRFNSIRRNEVAALASKGKTVYIEDARQQKAGVCLADVEYRLHADLEFLPPEQRKTDKPSEANGPETPSKYFSMFERRAAKGQWFFAPYLGCREFTADVEFIPEERLADEVFARPPLGSEYDRDFGLMLFDLDFEANPESPEAMFYRPRMTGGVIEVPDRHSPEVLK